MPGSLPMSEPSVLIIEENSAVPEDTRVWSEATTLRDAGWHVTVICPAGRGAHLGQDNGKQHVKSEDLQGVRVLRYPLRFAEHGVLDYLVEYLTAFFSIAALSWRVWRTHRFDILHICNPPDIFFPLAFFYRWLGVRIIFDHHDLFPETIAIRFGGVGGRLLYGAARLCEHLTFRTAHVVISTNQSYRQVALSRGRVPADRAIIVRNGPRIQEFVPVAPVPQLKHGFPYLACYAGVMGYDDGLLELVESIRYLVHTLKREDIYFVLLGDGAVRQEVLNRIRTWQLQDYVELPGMILDRYRLREYLSSADLLLSPEPPCDLNQCSTFVKIGEYMAMGKPLVAYDLVETRFTANGDATYVQAGNTQAFAQAIVDLIDDPARRERMGKLGRQRIEAHLGWEHQQQQLLYACSVALDEL